MWEIIKGILAILFLVLKNKFEKDAKKKEEKNALSREVDDAVFSGDISRINVILGKLRK